MKIREAILRLGCYQPPLEGRNPREYLLLDFNESPVPPSSRVTEHLIQYLQGNALHVYPSYGDFLNHLSNYTHQSPEQLILTNGSDQAIDIVLRSILGEGDEMVIAKPSFSMFFQIAGTLGAKVTSPTYSETLEFPFEALQQAITPETKLLVIVSPNNPTGTSVTEQQLEYFLKTYPDMAVLLDEAYFEFTRTTMASLIQKYSNLIILRTFSKALAIPSLRLGYVIGAADYIQQLYKIRGPYDVNMFAVIAATVQLQHPESWQQVVDEVMLKAKPKLLNFFDTHHVSYSAGDANFVLVKVPNPQEAVAYLKEHKILVRPMKVPLDTWFRMSVGLVEHVEQFINVFQSYIKTTATSHLQTT